MFRLLLPFALILSPLAARTQEPTASAVQAVIATDDESWDHAYAIAGRDDALARDLITWLRLRDGAGVFADYQRFTQTRTDWPGMDRLRARGEEAIEPDTPATTIINWFGDTPPETGQGAVALARALITQGAPDKAETVLTTLWAEDRLSDDGHAAMINAFPDILSPHHAARVDGLLWRWRTSDADRMIDLLDHDQKALVLARIGYIRKLGDAESRHTAVPDALRDHVGLAYDRFNWLADTGERTLAIALVKERSTSPEALGQPFRWSGWRRALARWEMRQERYDSAYELASKHFLTEGTSFADLEWIAGYLSLTFMDQPQRALAHFQTAAGAVDSPISVGRMQYWIGRTQDALAQPELAKAAYEISSQHQTSFYGLLAAEKLGKSLNPALTGRSDPTDWQGADFMSEDLTQAALILLAAGERGHAVTFFAELGKTLDADELARLGAYLREKNEAYFAVLLGKTAVRRGVLVPSIYFPLHDMQDMQMPVPKSLALSIARRESEFNAGVGSPVGALGLMQLMPATAKEVAGFIGEPYSRGRLTSDWAYNARLGSKYLSVLEEDFGYSPVMMAAGYNAGPSRPKRWMDERGDPRVGKADIVDWIEHIPFRETRNYVMRVTESIPVYEARLTGRAGPVRFTDLLIGIKPNKRPFARPANLIETFTAAKQAADDAAKAAEEEAAAKAVSEAAAGGTAAAAPSGPSGPQPISGVRPISRPGG